MITIASLFDGIGGTPLCATMCGAEPVWASEIEKFPIRVTEHHFPHMKHYGDITKINGAEVEPVDIIVGGSPCQDLSVAGKRAGIKHTEFGDEESTRSGLFMEQVRIVKEMRVASGATKPRYVVWENVPGAFSSNNGEDFRAVIEEFCRIADPAVSIPRSPAGWANSGSVLGDGFSLSWRTVDAQYWGVPQRRRRIYLVLDLGGQSAPQILFEREGLFGDSAQGKHEGQGVAGDVENCIGDAVGIKCLNPDHPQSARIYDPSGIWHSLNANEGGGQSRDAILCREVYEWHNQDSRIKGPIDTACTLNTNADGREGHLVAYVKSTRPKCKDGDEKWVEADIAPTQNCFDQGDIRTTTVAVRTAQTGANGTGVADEVAHTLDCANGQAVAQTYQDKTGCLTPGAHPGSYNGQDAYNDMLVAQKTVRRLTPLECERLQGYPDGWTDISGATDSARYKALGNSFAIPNAYFVISGCVEAIRDSA